MSGRIFLSAKLHESFEGFFWICLRSDAPLLSGIWIIDLQPQAFLDLILELFPVCVFLRSPKFVVNQVIDVRILWGESGESDLAWFSAFEFEDAVDIKNMRRGTFRIWIKI